MYIEKIHGPQDVKKLNEDELVELADEMRKALIKRASIHMGHVGPDLGFIEPTIALHYVFDSPKDKIVYDISHQTYPHKMLTGRKDAYLYEEHYNDVSAYSNPKESEHDYFEIGHTSVSIDLALGMAKARDLTSKEGNVIAVIGDGSLSGGEALEGLNIAGEFDRNFIIVFNDNQMSIAENHGGMYRSLKALRESNGTASDNLFKAMGLDYIYVQNGNEIHDLIQAFSSVKDSTKPVVVHINTLKGKGLKFAEDNKEQWHWHLPFYLDTGEVKPEYQWDGENYSDITANFLLAKMKKDPSVVVVTSGVPGTAGFTPAKRQEAGKQFMDVGIAEQSGVAVASGIAKNGGKPVYFTEATFIQRAYDQIAQDVSINHSPITILAFDGSIYGMSDVTHVGFYDLAMMSNIPDVVYLAPASKEEYLAMLDWSIEQQEHPVVIRVPAVDVCTADYPVRTSYDKIGKFTVTKQGNRVAIIAPGTFYTMGQEAVQLLSEKYQVNATLINPGFVSHIDEELLEELKKDHQLVAVLEDGVIEGGFSPKIGMYYANSDMKVLAFGLKKAFYDMYDTEALLEENHLTPKHIAEDIMKSCL